MYTASENVCASVVWVVSAEGCFCDSGFSSLVLYCLSWDDSEALSTESDVVADVVAVVGVSGVCTMGVGPGGLATISAEIGWALVIVDCAWGEPVLCGRMMLNAV